MSRLQGCCKPHVTHLSKSSLSHCIFCMLFCVPATWQISLKFVSLEIELGSVTDLDSANTKTNINNLQYRLLWTYASKQPPKTPWKPPSNHWVHLLNCIAMLLSLWWWLLQRPHSQFCSESHVIFAIMFSDTTGTKNNPCSLQIRNVDSACISAKPQIRCTGMGTFHCAFQMSTTTTIRYITFYFSIANVHLLNSMDSWKMTLH